MGEDLADMTPEELRGAMDGYLDKGVEMPSSTAAPVIFHAAFAQSKLFSPASRLSSGRGGSRSGGKPEVQTHATSSEGLRLAVEAGIDLIQASGNDVSRDLPDELIQLIVSKKLSAGCART